MATKTPNYNLVKPELNDFADIRVLNGNMDIIDEQLKKASDIDLSDYMPITGGNFTGDITVQNKNVICIIDVVSTEQQTSIKYSDGTLIQYGTVNNSVDADWIGTFTFQVPFTDANYFVLTSIYGDSLYPNGQEYNTSLDRPCWVYQGNKTTTSCKFASDDKSQAINILAIGKWRA